MDLSFALGGRGPRNAKSRYTLPPAHTLGALELNTYPQRCEELFSSLCPSGQTARVRDRALDGRVGSRRLQHVRTSPTTSSRLLPTGVGPKVGPSSPSSVRNAPSAGRSARWAPSSTLRASERPSGEAAQRRASAPPFEIQPGNACIRFVSRALGPRISSG